MHLSVYLYVNIQLCIYAEHIFMQVYLYVIESITCSYITT